VRRDTLLWATPLSATPRRVTPPSATPHRATPLRAPLLPATHLRGTLTRALLLAALLLGVCPLAAPPVARATPSARLGASFTPERLGGRTTLGFEFQILAPAGQVPPALTAVDLSYPNYLGFALSGLGLATCTGETLQAFGPSRCPANSVMGYGHALAEIALGPAIVTETAPITILRALDQQGHFALLFYAAGNVPLDAHVTFPGLLYPAPAPYGGSVDISVPLVPSIPGAPDVAVVRLRATIGPRGVAYYEQADGTTLAYRPPGMLLPRGCPPGGFPFAAEFHFLDGSQTSARTEVPCPPQGRPVRRGAHLL